MNFNRIIINDSTSFKLPEEFKEEFKGSGGAASGMYCDIQEGTKNDAEYLSTMAKHIESGDLKLADLGYYKIDYLKEIHEKKAFFISKLKSDTTVYMKNPNPERNKIGNIKKSTEYIKIDIQELVKPLAEGETIELKDIYIGSKKDLITRLILTKLTEENKRKR